MTAETLKLPENINESEAALSSEVFQSGESIELELERQIDQGTISVKPVTKEERGSLLLIPVSQEDIVLGEGETMPFSIEQDELERRVKPEALPKIYDLEAKNAKQRTIFEVAGEAWWLSDGTIKEDVEKGQVSQIESLKVGDIEIPLVNFTETKLTQAQVEHFANAIRAAGVATEGTAQRVLKAICIQHQGRFGGDKVMGSTRADSGIIRLSEEIFKGTFDEDVAKVKGVHNELPVDSHAEVTLLHELGHIVQANVGGESGYKTGHIPTYAEATGWEERTVDVTDDYGKINMVRQVKRQMPDLKAAKLNEDREFDEVSLKDIASIEEIIAAKPTTAYGETNSHEDFAEAFPVYVLAREKLEPIRRNAIQNLLAKSDKKGKTGEASAESVNPHEYKFQLSETPREVKFKLSYSVVNPDRGPEQNAEWRGFWGTNDKKIVDDYGNEVPGLTRHGHMTKY